MPREKFYPKLSNKKRILISGDQHITIPNETILVLIEFKVRGNLRFLSHAEMVRVFDRACVRAGIKMVYSKGYNPRPRLSLPLPRSVGIETDDDLLCLKIKTNTQNTNDLCTLVKTKLWEQLPDGVELATAKAVKAKGSIQPCQATYLIAVREECLNDELKSRIKRLPASENLNLQRQTGFKNSRLLKTVDVRPFLKSIGLDETNIAVECRISPNGSIRVDEILKLLELDAKKLAAPIRRTKVQWQVSES